METLIIAGGEINLESLRKYLKKHQNLNIIAVDKGLEVIHQLQIKPNHIVGDFDSVLPSIIQYYQKIPQVIFHQYNPQKDNTDTDIALHLAICLKSSTITMMGALGKRMDHTLANIHILKAALEADIFCQIIDERNKIYLVKDEMKIQKEQTKAKYISLIPLTTTVEGVTLTGFKYSLKDQTLFIGESLGVSNEIIQDCANIKLKKGILIVIESMD